VLSLTSMVGCWEQWSNDWFPQMKWQKAVQAFEEVTYDGQGQGFVPPEGTVPITGGEAPVDKTVVTAGDHLVNPRSATLESIENGRAQFEIFCVACHGEKGMGDGPVSAANGRGPFQGVFPIAVANARTDGHVYTTIRYGRTFMPSYRRIPSDDRWDIVNYIRYLNNPDGSLN
jgi:mono/diheme cytochrome c family protein